jgi:hypothetical protein
MYKSVVKSILSYGDKTWTIKQKHRRKLLATEMDYLRRSSRISRMDRIRTKMGMQKDILQEIEEQQQRWYGHVMRMDDCRTARQMADWNPQGKRRRGRPVNTWKDGIRDSMQRRNLKDEECFDREIWRTKIMSLG